MRAFVAVEVPPPDLPVAVPRPPERHLTLRFFDELPEPRVGVVVAALEESAREVAPFEVELRGGGAFPDARRARVVYLAIGEGARALQDLAARIDARLTREGFPADARPLVPHVTLFRVHGPRDATRATEVLAGLPDRPLGRFTVGELRLFESRLTREGAEHTVVASIPLPGRAIPADAR